MTERCRAPRIRLRIVTSEYSAHHLQVLEGLEAVRKRPGMYIGSTDSRGLMHCLWEIIDNSVDEALGGHGTRIDVILHADGSVEVRDRARGIPVDIEPRTGLSGVEVVFTKLHAGGKFGGGSYAASGGLHGVGASVVNALSERLDVEVDRGGKTWAMSFHRGEPGVFAGSPSGCRLHPVREELRAAGRRAAPRRASPARGSATGRTGRSSRRMRRSTSTSSSSGRARRRSSCRASRSSSATSALDAQDDEPVETSYRYDGGISEFAEFLAPDAAVTDTWRLTGTGTFTETVPVLQPTGAMVPDRARARMPRRHRRALGDRLRHGACARSSTSSPRPRAGRTSRASSRG